MRIVGFTIILLITAAFIPAQTPIMHIHMKDGTIDSISSNRLNAGVEVTFSKTKMILGVIDTVNYVPVRSVLWFCTSQIDSITFDANPAEAAALSKYPASDQRASKIIP